MQINEHDLYTIDQTVEEISPIFARGYLHNEKSRRLATTSGGPAANAKQGEDFDLCTPLLQKSEGSGAKAPGGEAVVSYCEPSATPDLESSGFPPKNIR
jgi:hypothetical protein